MGLGLMQFTEFTIGISARSIEVAQGDVADAMSGLGIFQHSLNDIQFMLSLNKDGFVNVVENPGLIIHGPFGDPYAQGERFRVKIVHNPDGSATISYQRSCTPGATCDGNEFFTSNAPATYPLRIDTSFREKDASLKKVTVVRIK